MSLITVSQPRSTNNNAVGNLVTTAPTSATNLPSSIAKLCTSSKLTTNNETMSPPCHQISSTINSMSIIRPLVEILDGKTLHNGDILGPIPNLFKWLQSELIRIEKYLENSTVVKSSANTVVELALTKEEQNLEIVFYNELYYFEVIRSFRVQQSNGQNLLENLKNLNDEKPKAWFCKDIEEQISPMRPAQTWLNGKELFCCLMCNHFSFYSNHLVLHIMLDCPKKIINQTEPSTSNKNRPESSNKSITMANNQQDKQQRKQPIRSFDIMSLLNSGKNETIAQERNEDQIVVDVDDNDEVEVDVETLDSTEENLERILLNHHQQQNNFAMINNKTTKRSLDNSSYGMDCFSSSMANNLYHHSTNKPEPIRKYNNNQNYHQNSKRYSSNKNNGNKTVSLPSNGNKSAFKKLKNASNHNSKTKLGLDGPNNKPVINGDAATNEFISNLSNLPYLYNKIAEQTITSNNNKNTANNNNPLFPTFCAEFLRNTNAAVVPVSNAISPTCSQQSESSTSTFNTIYSMTNGQDTKLTSKSMLSPGNQPQPSTSNFNSLESISPPLSESSRCSSGSNSNSPRYHSTENNAKKTDKSLGDDCESSSMIQLLPQSAQSSMANNPLFNLPPYFMPPTSAAASNPLITSLYLLSPSLTALSYQASNVCAYCNTAFRMTSDLVYHMRSHHKRTRAADELVNKKRRDDQLRCHICNETFRERHHLTRHMTSHQ